MGNGKKNVWDFLPASPGEVRKRGWKNIDVLLVTGDAYIDHPAVGVAVIGRILESRGYKVAVLSRPDWKDPGELKAFGKPRLFFGVTAGCLDSLVANRNAFLKKRKKDDYAPGGIPGGRPDRAAIVYSNMCRQAFPDVPIVLGGLEASLRRFAHFDWWSGKVRKSILCDSKADLLVYGMGEEQVLEVAKRLEKGKDLDSIKGTAKVLPSNKALSLEGSLEIPGFDSVTRDKKSFVRAQRMMEGEFRANGRILVQETGIPGKYLVQYTPCPPPSPDDLDEWAGLPFTRDIHPKHRDRGPVPAMETLRGSVASHRGCPGDCSFCSISLHQGRWVVSRTTKSLEQEIRKVLDGGNLKGRISDVGGPTANFYGIECPRLKKGAPCREKSCLVPQPCERLAPPGGRAFMAMLEKLNGVKGVKKICIGSGIRHDFLDREVLEYICLHNVSGQLKVAPEHCSSNALHAMNKPSWGVYEAFEKSFKALNKRLGKEQFLSNYFLVAHPGTTLEDAVELFEELAGRNYSPKQVQVFIPIPMTRSAAMFHTGMNPRDFSHVYVPRKERERRMHLALAQWKIPGNRKYIAEALKETGRPELLKKIP